MKLTAYDVGDTHPGWVIEPAPVSRVWMDLDEHRFAYRCLPLTMANQMGWVIKCPVTFTATWNGNMGHENAISFLFQEPDPTFHRDICSHFGNGVITFSIPWLFRTELQRNLCLKCYGRGKIDEEETPGVEKKTECPRCNGDGFHVQTPNGLLVRGLPNHLTYNRQALEGFVETWWSPFTFTMNWKVLQPHVPVLVEKGEPICFIQPYCAHILDDVECLRKPLASEPDLQQKYDHWSKHRDRFNADPTRESKDWQRFYHSGKGSDDSEPDPFHLPRVTLKEFKL